MALRRDRGKVLHIPQIAVDCFEPGHETLIYFLTHAHADHLHGLCPGWFDCVSPSALLYCSAITRALVLDKWPDFPAERVVALPLNKTLDIQGLGVKLLDASHCPGAVMFLFTYQSKIVLHTGDFRPPEGDMARGWYRNIPSGVDMLYLDDTYLSSQMTFPTRPEALEILLRVLQDNRGKTVLIGIDSLGKEEMLVCVSRRLGTRIVVSEARLRVITLTMGTSIADECFTLVSSDDEGAGRIIVVSRKLLSNEYLLTEYDGEALGIRVSAWAWDPSLAVGSGVLQVPYSLHSSYTELKEFVSWVQPGKVIPLTSESARDVYEAMGKWIGQTLEDTRAREVKKPAIKPASKRRKPTGAVYAKGKENKETVIRPRKRNCSFALSFLGGSS